MSVPLQYLPDILQLPVADMCHFILMNCWTDYKSQLFRKCQAVNCEKNNVIN